MRRAMGLTFEVRHYPLINGRDDENFGKGMVNCDWEKHAYAPTKRVKSEPGEYQSPEGTETSEPAKDDVPMVFDVELGQLVPLE